MVSVSAWQVWLVAALLLFVAEILAPGFWLLSVAVGCVLAGAVALVVPGVLAPALSFAAGTLLSLAGIRPFLLKRLHPPGREIKTNVDALVGRVGVVSERIDPDRKSTRLNSSHSQISYAVFCLKKKKTQNPLEHGLAASCPEYPPPDAVRTSLPRTIALLRADPPRRMTSPHLSHTRGSVDTRI